MFHDFSSIKQFKNVWKILFVYEFSTLLFSNMFTLIVWILWETSLETLLFQFLIIAYRQRPQRLMIFHVWALHIIEFYNYHSNSSVKHSLFVKIIIPESLNFPDSDEFPNKNLFSDCIIYYYHALYIMIEHISPCSLLRGLLIVIKITKAVWKNERISYPISDTMWLKFLWWTYLTI